MADAVTRRSRRLQGGATRSVDVQLDEDIQYTEQEPDEWPAAEHAAYAPPWRVRLHDGQYGPWYGPSNPNQFVTAKRHWAEDTRGGIGSPSLWDEDEYNRCRGPGHEADTVEREVVRKDMEQVVEYLERMGHRLGKRELEVAYAYWVDGLSLGRAAAKVGISKHNVRSIVRRLREKVAGNRWYR